MRRAIRFRRWAVGVAVMGLSVTAGINAAVAAPPASTASSTARASAVGTPQIVGGQIAPEGAWRAQAALLSRKNGPLLSRKNGHGRYEQMCGGTLIAPRWVLTAAHCVADLLPSDVKVAVGIQSLTRITEADQLAVDAVVVHPMFDLEKFAVNDLALLRLVKPRPGPYARLVGKAQDGKWGTGSLATVTGWGSTTPESSTGEQLVGLGGSDELRQVDVPIVSDEVCARTYPLLNRRRMVCAGWPEGGRDTCAGDSGGPLWVPIGRVWYQVGIVSMSAGCAQPRVPGVYTEVRALLGFINATVRPAA